MCDFDIQEYKIIDANLLRKNPEHIFAVETTMDGQLCAGSLPILDEPNVYGIPVRRRILNGTHVPFSDQEAERAAVLSALREIYRKARGRTLRLPLAGIGSGPFGLAANSPLLHREVYQILDKHFCYSRASRMIAIVQGAKHRLSAYHYEVFSEVCKRGGSYMTHSVAEFYGLTLEQLRSYCQIAGKDLEDREMLLAVHLPTYRWACEE